jgi:hypothetical protein
MSTQHDLLLSRLAEERAELQLAITVVKSAIDMGIADTHDLSAAKRKLAVVEEKLALRERQNLGQYPQRRPCFRFSEALLQSSASNPWRPSAVHAS